MSYDEVLAEYKKMKKDRDELRQALLKVSDLFFLAKGSDHLKMYIEQAEYVVKSALERKK